jgi:hypothetical protein
VNRTGGYQNRKADGHNKLRTSMNLPSETRPKPGCCQRRNACSPVIFPVLYPSVADTSERVTRKVCVKSPKSRGPGESCVPPGGPTEDGPTELPETEHF